jgi:MFS family permease
MIELLEQQKKLTANQWKLIVTGNLADLLDFFDFFLIGYVLAFITKEWQLTYWQGAVILLSSGIGAVPGAFFWGWVADKVGRRTYSLRRRSMSHWPPASCISRPDRTVGLPAGFSSASCGFLSAPAMRGFMPSICL